MACTLIDRMLLGAVALVVICLSVMISRGNRLASCDRFDRSELLVSPVILAATHLT